MIEMLPHVPASDLSRKLQAPLTHHSFVEVEADHDTLVKVSQINTNHDETTIGTTVVQRDKKLDRISPSPQTAQEIPSTLTQNETPEESHQNKDLILSCHHFTFPTCNCATKAVNPPQPSNTLLRHRSDHRNHCGATMHALRDVDLEVFDENEASDFQESETETENTQADTTDAESDYTTGLESDVEGAMGGEDPKHLAPPGTPGVRRASIVTANSRKDEMLTSPEPVKVAVFGTDGVGKSALIVRLLTGRFIGEYDPTLEAVYSYKIPLPDHTLPLQVMDTAGHVEVVEVGRERQVSWGDGFILVFSLTSHCSFTALNHIRRVILELTPGSPRPMVLVGNKADLAHAREVQDQEIRDLANMWGCDYFEVAAPEPWQVVVRPFSAIYQAVIASRASH